jgi:hypothetical protein
VKYREIIARNIKKRGRSLGYVSTVDSRGRTIWIADAHRDDGKRFVVHADEKLTAFILPFAYLGALPSLLPALALGGETAWDRQSYETVLWNHPCR